MNSNGPVISVRGLRKFYGTFEAVRGVDFEVRAGEVFGLLGPNGAGKTTTIEILEGLRQRSSGETLVLGLDPGVQSREIKDRIGVCLQATNLPDKIKVHEALALFASFYSNSVDRKKLLERLQLSEKRDEYYSKLSGGQKQRVAFALAMINDPQVAVPRRADHRPGSTNPPGNPRLDSGIARCPTVHSANYALHRGGRAAVRPRGDYRRRANHRDRDAARDPAAHAGAEPDRNRMRTAYFRRRTARVPLREKHVFSGDRRALTVHSAQPAKTIVELVKWIDQLGVGLADIHLKRPTLEDVFIELTGKQLRE